MEAIRSACGRHSQLQPATANWRQKHHCQVTPPGWSIQSSCQPCWEQPQATSTCPSPGPSWPWRLWVHFSASVHLAGCPLASASSALINAQLFPLHHCITKGQLLNPCKKKIPFSEVFKGRGTSVSTVQTWPWGCPAASPTS